MKKPTINRQKLRTQAAPAKTFDDSPSGVASEGLPPVCILDHLPDSGGQRRRVAGKNSHGVVIVSEQLRGPAAWSGDHRFATGHGLHDGSSKRLRFCAGMNDDVQGAINVGRILLEGNKADSILDLHRDGQRPQLLDAEL